MTTARTISNTALTVRYTVALILSYVALHAIVWALDEFFDIGFKNSAMGLIMVFVSAMYVGQVWFAREGARPPSGRAWTVSFFCTLVTAALQGALFLLIYRFAMMAGEAPLGALPAGDRMILAGVAAGATLVGLLLIRFGIGWGARQAAKQQALKAKRAAA